MSALWRTIHQLTSFYNQALLRLRDCPPSLYLKTSIGIVKLMEDIDRLSGDTTEDSLTFELGLNLISFVRSIIWGNSIFLLFPFRIPQPTFFHRGLWMSLSSVCASHWMRRCAVPQSVVALTLSSHRCRCTIYDCPAQANWVFHHSGVGQCLQVCLQSSKHYWLS